MVDLQVRTYVGILFHHLSLSSSSINRLESISNYMTGNLGVLSNALSKKYENFLVVLRGNVGETGEFLPGI